MKQYITLDEPVPSIELDKLKYEDGKWQYVYCFETPIKLTETPRKTPLYLAGSLPSLEITNEIGENMINKEIWSVEDLREAFRRQRESDLAFREKFEATHPNNQLTLRTFIVDNKNQSAIGKYIVKMQKNLGDKTMFVGRS
jgi:hypothetical protein